MITVFCLALAQHLTEAPDKGLCCGSGISSKLGLFVFPKVKDVYLVSVLCSTGMSVFLIKRLSKEGKFISYK